MKTTKMLIAASLAFFSVSFAGEPTEYKADASKSKVTWTGKKVTGEHSGNISISEGKLTSDGKRFTGGTFVIDMESMTNTDITNEEYKGKLMGHLKSDDFFSTQKFPKATLVINKISPAGKDEYKVKGSLTIKGITKEVEFPATIKSSGSELTAKAKIEVDRTKYDIKYGSGSFFDNLGDKAIDDKFFLDVNLVAKK